jgi:hypothetical protein
LKRRATLGPYAFVFGSPSGEFQDSFKTAWESLLLLANGHDTKRSKPGARVDRAALRRVDLHWHDMRHHAASLIMRRRSFLLLRRWTNLSDTGLRRSA